MEKVSMKNDGSILQDAKMALGEQDAKMALGEDEEKIIQQL